MIENVHNIDNYRNNPSAPEPPPDLKGADGGGTFGGMNERLAVLETQMKHVVTAVGELRGDVKDLRSDARVDFRILFGAIIFAALGLAGLMAKGFKWL